MNNEFVVYEVKAVDEDRDFLKVRDFIGTPSGILYELIPKSVITESSEVKKKGDTGKLIVTKSWARQMGWTE
jgi:hypothetical protein